jgi:hydroxypyruvate isomerase
MPRFAANLTMLYNEAPFLDRFALAAKAGFKGVEFLFPYDFEPADIASRLSDNGLELVLHNLPAGDWAKGERGIACHPDRIEEFRAGVGRAIGYAQALGCTQVNCLAGILPTGVEAAAAHATLVENLVYSSQKLKDAGIRLVIEAINTRDIPGFFVNRTRQAVDIIDAVGSDNLKLQYDIYHMQIMEGDIARTIEANLPVIGHIQLADNPGRNEPGTGELNYPFLFKHLDRIGYTGWVGCEYKPATSTQAGLGWLAGATDAHAAA